MQIIVMGSGVIGVTSAYYLALAGHKVMVIDHQPGPALETSFGNAGQISPGYAAPWAAPGVPLKALKWLFQDHAPLSIVPDGTLFQLRWIWKMLRQCTLSHYTVNKRRMVQLAEYSRDCFKELRATTDIKYEGRQQGTLQVFRTAAQYRAAQKDIVVLEQMGIPYTLMQAHQLADIEPALVAVQNKLKGGLRLPNDETGDCRVFTTALSVMAENLGVQFCYGKHVDALKMSKDKVMGVQCGKEVITADAFVVALGSYSTGLLQGIVDIPVYPVKGYSITVPICDMACAPVSTVLDETYKIAITRFDNRIRVGGMAELVGFNTQLKLKRQKTLEMVLNDLFPGAGDLKQGEFWTGLRPMTPDGTPLIGPTSIANLFLNTGHGTLGWTMSCGSGKVLADIISEKVPAMDMREFNLSRYS